MDRSKRRARFLTKCGWNNAISKTLAADASFRRYYRLESCGERVVLMDAPPSQEDVRRFVAVAQHLLNLGLSAPKILGQDIFLSYHQLTSHQLYLEQYLK